MQDTELIRLWKAQDAKIEMTLAINRQLLKETINLKAHSALGSLRRQKTAGIIAFVLYLLVLGYLLVYALGHYKTASVYFVVSVAAIALINIKGFADYINHLYMANTINYDGSIMQIQEQLSLLQLSIIRHARTMCLQFPFFTTFYLSSHWFPGKVGWGYILFQLVLTGSFTWLSYWLYKNHKVENLNKKWFRKMIAGSGGKSVARAIDFYTQMEEFKKDG